MQFGVRGGSLLMNRIHLSRETVKFITLRIGKVEMCNYGHGRYFYCGDVRRRYSLSCSRLFALEGNSLIQKRFLSMSIWPKLGMGIEDDFVHV